MSEEELIEILKEFEKNRVEQLKEPSRNLFYAIMKIADERDKCKIVLDKIKEFAKIRRDWLLNNCPYDKIGTQNYIRFAQDILELLEEIE